MKKARVFIWGSRISRETFEAFNPTDFELLRSVEDQSAISATSRPVTLADFDVSLVPDDGNLCADFRSTLLVELAACAQDVDLVIVDLLQESLGVYLLPDGSVITRSMPLARAKLEPLLPGGTTHIPFGTTQHFTYWSDAISTIATYIRAQVPHAGIALLDVPLDTAIGSQSYLASLAPSAEPLARYVAFAASQLGAEIISASDIAKVGREARPLPVIMAESILDLGGRSHATSGKSNSGVPTVSTPATNASAQSEKPYKSPQEDADHLEQFVRSNQIAALNQGLRRVLADGWSSHRTWKHRVSVHEFARADVTFAFDISSNGTNVEVSFLTRTSKASLDLDAALTTANIAFTPHPVKDGHYVLARITIPERTIDEGIIASLQKILSDTQRAMDDLLAHSPSSQP